MVEVPLRSTARRIWSLTLGIERAQVALPAHGPRVLDDRYGIIVVARGFEELEGRLVIEPDLAGSYFMKKKFSETACFSKQPVT